MIESLIILCAVFIAGFALGFILRSGFEGIKPNLDNDLMARLLGYIDKVNTMRANGRTISANPDMSDPITNLNPQSKFAGIYGKTTRVKRGKKDKV